MIADQESTSEDAFASYAVKMWGKVSGDGNMEARGSLMLAIQARTFSNYFLMESDNKNQPANFIDNKVTGILFEGKVDHTTYFGTKTEYIEGSVFFLSSIFLPSSSPNRPSRTRMGDAEFSIISHH